MTKPEIVEALLRQMVYEADPRFSPLPGMAEGAKNMLRPMARDLVASVPCLVVDRDRAIMCFTCGAISHNPSDVKERYCGQCHKFHDRPEPVSGAPDSSSGTNAS